tara:strand:- start:11934 stop:15896 length:3963 start_codon:yes stop_codon:yes gene_type:complete
MNDENLTFISASSVGTFMGTNTSFKGRLFGANHKNIGEFYTGISNINNFIPNDFVGLNTIIFEPFDANSHTLGYPALTFTNNDNAPGTLNPGQTEYCNYINSSIVVGMDPSTGKIDNTINMKDPSGNGWGELAGNSTILNAIIHHRQGPYGWPTWKQVRTGNHPLARYWKENSTWTITLKPTINQLTSLMFYDNNATNLAEAAQGAPINLQFVQSPVSNRDKPLVHTFRVQQDGNTNYLTLRSSYANLKDQFANNNQNLWSLKTNKYASNIEIIYDDLKNIYIDEDYGDNTPFKEFMVFRYGQGIYPKQTNKFLQRTRQRTVYGEVAGTGLNGIDQINPRTFWKVVSSSATPVKTVAEWDLSPRRIRTSEALNSQGNIIGARTISGSALGGQPYAALHSPGIRSVWSLDTGINTGSAYSNGTIVAGELGWRQTQGSVGGFRTQAYNTCSAGAYRQDLRADYSGTYTQIPVYASDLISGKQAFFNSYEDFAEDIRGLGKGMSILPEFKISEHMEYYVVEEDGDFLAQNDAYLSLEGAAITSSAASELQYTGERDSAFIINSRTSGMNETFFSDYSHSDFLKYFDMFKSDHKGKANLSSYTLKTTGIKKLLPYRGFYPHQRALQLATLFSQSFAESYNFNGTHTNTYSPNEKAGWNAILRPFFNPGVCFNSLRSAVAVNFPMMTGSSVVDLGIENVGDILGYTSIEGGTSNYKLPFEAIISPDQYLPLSTGATTKYILNDEVTLGDWAAGTYNFNTAYALYGGTHTELYSLAANNFFGEIPRFFLENKAFTSITSAPQGEWQEVVPTKTYYMDVSLYKTKNMLLSEGNAEENLRGSIYGNPNASNYANTTHSNKFKDPAYAAYTPPYFYEKSTARIAYTPSTPGRPTVKELLSRIEQAISLDDNFKANDFGATAVSGTFYTGSAYNVNAFDGGDLASSNRMRISGSVNLFGRAKYKKVTYDNKVNLLDPDGGYIPLVFEDTSDEAFDAWTVGTKFECPALNFVDATQFHSASGPRGIWGGYGRFPKGSEGMYLEVKDPFPDADPATTGSLLQVCKFSTFGSTKTRKKIGKMAKEKQISEAIVAIPYVWNSLEGTNQPALITYPGTQKKFFSISHENHSETLLNLNAGEEPASVSCGDLYKKMKKYNLPPQFDFLTFPFNPTDNSGLKPIVMFMFEFTHTLSRQDLRDIWQGLMPQISRQAEVQEVKLTYPTGKKEFFDGKEIPSYVRWMVFKVKKKAETSYFAVTSDVEDDSNFKFKFQGQEKPPEYNYNWPYDYFSLVELANIESMMNFTGNGNEIGEVEEDVEFQGSAFTQGNPFLDPDS